MIVFNKKWYNPLYFILNEIIKDNSIRTVLVYGGKSSAKTVSICQIIAKDCYVKGSNSIAFRKESTIIPTTLKKSFNLAIDKQFLYPAIEKQDRRYLCDSYPGWKSEIVLKGLDDEEKAKGIESYKYVYLDELNHFLKAEYDQFNISLRGIEGQKIFASWNPVDENSWVKKELIDSFEFVDSDKWKLPSENSFVKISTCGKCVLIKTTYLDNYWIAGSPDGSYGYVDENLIAEYKELEFKNPMSYRVNVLGEWGKVVFGGEFWKDFEVDKHVRNLVYNPELPIHLSWDENVDPYLTCEVWQIINNHAYQIDEIFLPDPRNRRHHVCNEFKKRYPVHVVKGLFIYGDRTSKKEDTAKEKGENFFTDILKYLIEYHPTLRLQSSNPSVKQSGDFINEIYRNPHDIGIEITISNKCNLSIYDYQHVLENSEGGILKSKKTDKRTGKTFEEFGHATDAKRYIITKAFEKEYLKWLGKNKPKPKGITRMN